MVVIANFCYMTQAFDPGGADVSRNPSRHTVPVALHIGADAALHKRKWRWCPVGVSKKRERETRDAKSANNNLDTELSNDFSRVRKTSLLNSDVKRRQRSVSGLFRAVPNAEWAQGNFLDLFGCARTCIQRPNAWALQNAMSHFCHWNPVLLSMPSSLFRCVGSWKCRGKTTRTNFAKHL